MKKPWIILICATVVLAVVFVPLAFKWWGNKEEPTFSFSATVIAINDRAAVVSPLPDEEIAKSSDKITFSIADLDPLDVVVGMEVKVTCEGEIMETYPAQVQAVSWQITKDLRGVEYTEQWIDKTVVEPYENNIFDHITITAIYSNCFFAKTVIPMSYEIKLNGSLTDEWCIGDQVTCTYENTYYDSENNRVEVDMLTIAPSDWEPEPGMNYKPVIYLYPQEKTDVTVLLTLNGKLTCTYPNYDNGWQVTALPDGTLIDSKGQIYNYLYWEGETYTQYDFSKGFCVKGEDTAAFLEEALAKLGLNRREANEFIVYWLPLMEQNPYNVISFQADRYTDVAQLHVTPAPDTVIRVFMAWKSVNDPISIPQQELTAPQRKGFTVVEWGGTEIK